MNHNKPTIRRISDAILLAGLAFILTGCKITINTPLGLEEVDPDQVATGIHMTVMAYTAQAQNSNPDAASGVQVDAEGTPAGLVIIDPELVSNASPIPSETLQPGAPTLTLDPQTQAALSVTPIPSKTLRPGAPSLTPKTQPQASATSPGGASLQQSKPSNTPALGAIVTDTPSGMGFLSTETPFFGVLPSNTPGGMYYLPTNTPPSGMQYLPANPAATPQGATPKAPTSFQFTHFWGSPENGEIEASFQWTNNAGNDSGYHLYLKGDGDPNILRKGGQNYGHYTVPVNGLCNRTMTFYVRHFNDYGGSLPSNEVVVVGPCPPGPPKNFTLLETEYDYDKEPDFEFYHFSFYAPANQGSIIHYWLYSTDYPEVQRELGTNEFYFTVARQCYLAGPTTLYLSAWTYGGESTYSNAIHLPKPGCLRPSGSGANW